MTNCWVMAIWSCSHCDRTPDIGHPSDFIFCQMLLCSALDRQLCRWFFISSCQVFSSAFIEIV